MAASRPQSRRRRRRRGWLTWRRWRGLGRRGLIFARLTSKPGLELGGLLSSCLGSSPRLLLIHILRLAQRAPSTAIGARQLRLATGAPHRGERTESKIVSGPLLGVGETLVRVGELRKERRISSSIRMMPARSILPGEPDLIWGRVLRYTENGVVVDHLFPHILCHSSVSPSPVLPQ